jgi:carboxyl-terminal processing protease
MKLTKFLFPAVCLSLLISCKPAESEEDIIGSIDNNKYVNDWIMETLQTYYYWDSQLPKTTDLTLNPDAYFESVMYWYDPVTAPDGDRFSWIQENYTELLSSLSGVVSNEIGFDMTLYYKDDTYTNLIAQVNYVKKGTPAVTAGIKRGMFFDKVNGTSLTLSNYNDLLTFSAAQATFGVVTPVYDENNEVTGFADFGTKTVQTLSTYPEDPVYMDTVYTIDNHKIGYLVYHFFAPDGGTSDSKYDLELNAAFSRMKVEGITDFVLDLRYNSGGRISSAIQLASEIVPGVSDSKLFCFFRYNADLNDAYANAYGSESLKDYFSTNVLNTSGTVLESLNNIGDQLGGKLYVLTGSNTASASELIINGLKPYMNVVLIGDTTVGKNVASSTFYDEDHVKKNKWGMQPIIAKYFNSLAQSNFTAGFPPNYKVRDGGIGMLELGDPNERLLKTAISVITGTYATPAISTRSTSIQTVKRLDPPNFKMRGLDVEKPSFFK